jgi:hypothetical protein
VGRRVETRPARTRRLAAALVVAGFGLLNVAEAGWAHAIGVACLAAFILTGFAAAVPLERDGWDDTASTRETADR